MQQMKQALRQVWEQHQLKGAENECLRATQLCDMKYIKNESLLLNFILGLVIKCFQNLPFCSLQIQPDSYSAKLNCAV